MKTPRSFVIRGIIWLCILSPVSIAIIPGERAEGTDVDTVVRLGARAQQATEQPHAELQLLQLLNGLRGANGLPALRMDASLQGAAREHSHDMAVNGYVGHGTLGGQSVLERLAPVVRRGYVGENVTIAQTIEDAERAFTASQGHLHNMLNPVFHRVGIGIADGSHMGLVVTEDFAE